MYITGLIQQQKEIPYEKELFVSPNFWIWIALFTLLYRMSQFFFFFFWFIFFLEQPLICSNLNVNDMDFPFKQTQIIYIFACKAEEKD